DILDGQDDDGTENSLHDDFLEDPENLLAGEGADAAHELLHGSSTSFNINDHEDEHHVVEIEDDHTEINPLGSELGNSDEVHV
ncbi:unnamed protein product, partial [Amoebophrya sp. A25]